MLKQCFEGSGGSGILFETLYKLCPHGASLLRVPALVSRASVLEILLRHFIFRPLGIRPDCMSSIGAKRSHVESLKSFRHTGSGLLVCRTTAGAAVKLFKVEEMKESRPAASSRGLEKATSGRDSFISSTLKSLTAAPAVVLQTRSPLPVWRNDFEECASVLLTSLRHWTTLSVTHWRKLKSHSTSLRTGRIRVGRARAFKSGISLLGSAVEIRIACRAS